MVPTLVSTLVMRRFLGQVKIDQGCTTEVYNRNSIVSVDIISITNCMQNEEPNSQCEIFPISNSPWQTPICQKCRSQRDDIINAMTGMSNWGMLSVHQMPDCYTVIMAQPWFLTILISWTSSMPKLAEGLDVERDRNLFWNGVILFYEDRQCHLSLSESMSLDAILILFYHTFGGNKYTKC